MARFRNISNADVVFDDLYIGQRRKIVAGEVFWALPEANISTVVVIEDINDGYGTKYRRAFVTQEDVDDDPVNYTPGCVGKVKFIDEFIGVGDSQQLSGQPFKRVTFRYQNPLSPTKWSAIAEVELIEP